MSNPIRGQQSMNPASTVGSLWDGLNPNLIATFYEVDHNGAPIGSTVLRAAIADDAQLDITLNWQSPFEQAGPESKAPTVMAMLQSGALQPLADKLGAGEMARDGGVEAARGRTGMTKLNSTQVFSGMPPLKIQATLLLRAWRDPEMEVEMPLDQLMQWALPLELAPEGTMLTGAVDYIKGEKGFVDAALPSKAPPLIAMTYKGRTYAPLVMEAASVPLGAPVDKFGRFVQLAIPVTLSTLTAWDGPRWMAARSSL